MMQGNTSLLKMTNIGKSFSGVRVLEDIDLELSRGEVCILAGENGAGKSTLMKILTGVHNNFEGDIELKGNKVSFSSPVEAQKSGISIIHQELSIIQSLNVVDNIFLGREKCSAFNWVYRKEQRDLAKKILDKLGLDVDLDVPVGTYPVSIQQMIEIAKALAFDADIVVMDEPTSALSKPEVEQLFKIIEQLKSEGKGVIYISHKMNEIYRIADTIEVLRDGKFIGKETKENLPENKLISWIIGRELTQQFPERRPKLGHEVLRVEGFCVPDPQGMRSNVVEDVSFAVKKGEILGVVGLEGSGNHELLLGLFGAFGKTTSGSVTLNGTQYRVTSPAHAINNNIALLTNDRKNNGLVLGMSIENNISMASLSNFSTHGWLDHDKELDVALQHQSDMNIKFTSVKQPVSDLSGGNQQKVVLAKWLESTPDILFLDDPTRGVDVGAKKEIYELMNRWTEQGMTIVLLSSELPEIMAMSDRFIVMHRGKVTARFEKSEATQENVLQAAMGKKF